MGVDKKYCIIYEETNSYEEHVYAETEREARQQFEKDLQNGVFEATECIINKYEVEED